MYQGYILRKNLPDHKLVAAFTDKLYQYLFPLVENEEDFLITRVNKEIDLKLTLNSLITTCVVNDKTAINLILNTFLNVTRNGRKNCK